ncbi:PAS domain S-box protein [Devosia sp. A8/3-2]|nr:PAS domain S-box protein [Devosia sp. A8/3-2]
MLAAMGLAGGMLTLSLHQRQLFDEAAAGQVVTIMAMGLLLTPADPRFGDVGMGVASMGPILASLVARRPLRCRARWLLAAIVGLGAIASLFGISPIPVSNAVLAPTSVLAFPGCVGIVGHTANRINAAYEVYDKAQVTAYRHLIEHVQDAVIRFSSTGEVLLASRSSEELFGCRRYELTGTGPGERVHVLDRPAYLSAFADANLAGRTRMIELRMRRDDPAGATKLPRFIWVEISFSPVLRSKGDGSRFEVVALYRDVTGRKDGEVAMVEARRVAEESSDAKSRFLATIGHELRTPLNAVVGFSEMMTSGIGGELSPTHREYAGLIHQSGKHLLEVVRMLLDMSKIEAGKFELQAEPFHVEGLIEPCFSMVEQLAKERR